MAKTFGSDERRILGFFTPGTVFSEDGLEYSVCESGKPTCGKGEPKTDIYVAAIETRSNTSREYKISYKKANADFLENKITAERAGNLLGKDWSTIIFNATKSIEESFKRKPLIYKTSFRNTQAGSFTLGWKFELTNKMNGALSNKINVSAQQAIDIYSGNSLPDDKRNAYVNGRIVGNSGVAEYLLIADPGDVKSINDIVSNTVLIRNSFATLPPVYFACKALNYRSIRQKHDGNRSLCVFVNWFIDNNKLRSSLVFDNPLTVCGDEVKNSLVNCLRQLGIKTTEDISANNVYDPSIIHY